MVAATPTGLETGIVVAPEVTAAPTTRFSSSYKVILRVPRFSPEESELALFAERPCLRIYPPVTLMFGVVAVNVFTPTLSFTK